MHACWGHELLLRIIHHEHRGGISRAKGWLAPPWFWLLGSRAFIPTSQGQKLYSLPRQEASAPHHLCCTPSASPHPNPTQGPAPLSYTAQYREDEIRVIRKSSFPGLFKPGILTTGKVIVTKTSAPTCSGFSAWAPDKCKQLAQLA